MKNQFRKDADYWDHKLSNYLHDPPDKALWIPGHEKRSNELLSMLNLPGLNSELYKRADFIASGMDRTQLPVYDTDMSKNGAISFLEYPVITHPTGNNGALNLLFSPESCIDQVHSDMIGIVRRDTDIIADRFPNDPARVAAARFHYIHHVLRSRLAEENTGELSGLWYRIPADTRIPDHSIWQHCSLVSALSSCFAESENRQASLLVFSITPVQDFIEKARKLRDFWTGSLILSWLAFEGIREIVYSYGSDHILYPSLIGQPMMDRMLAEECGFGHIDRKEKGTEKFHAASFPNKFVCLVPQGNEKEIAERIEKRIRKSWTALGDRVRKYIEERTDTKDTYIREQFDRQMRHYLSFHWSACPFLRESKRGMIQELLAESVWKNVFAFLDDAKNLPYQTKGEGAYYQCTHALAQSFMAAGKTIQEERRPEEEGIKCQLHGDLEILHYKNPRSEDDPFWKRLKEAWGEERPDFKTTERLCSVAMVKRIAGIVLEEETQHPLFPFFQDFRFPSTTEIALTDWLYRVRQSQQELCAQLDEKSQRILAQYVHETETDREYRVTEKDKIEIEKISEKEREICRKIIGKMKENNDPVTDSDKYYAILLMDGDKMGSLVNGETLASTWESVIHPVLGKRMANDDFDSVYRDFWKKHLSGTRFVAPAVHAVISEALGDFSLYSVPSIVEKYKGKLIYAGGDDVCAVFPVSTVLQAAKKISEAYRMGFVSFPDNTEIQDSVPVKGRIGVHLGKGKGISISAGILISHHKRPLKAAIRQAHVLLKEKAKNEGCRNAVALELAKRSGGSRYFVSGWDDLPFSGLNMDNIPEEIAKTVMVKNIPELFTDLAFHLGNAEKSLLSSSFIYRLEELRPGIESIIRNCPSYLPQFLQKQIGRSEGNKQSEKMEIIAWKTAAIVAGNKGNFTRAETDALIIARFMGPQMRKSAVKEAVDE